MHHIYIRPLVLLAARRVLGQRLPAKLTWRSLIILVITWLLLRLAVRIILGTWPLVDCLCGAFCCRRLLPAPSAARRPFAQCFRLRLLDRRRRLRRGDLSRRACERSRSTCLGENGELLGPSGGAIARSTCTQNNMHDFDADCIRKKTKPTYMCETNTEPRQQQLITLKIFPRRVYMKPTT